MNRLFTSSRVRIMVLSGLILASLVLLGSVLHSGGPVDVIQLCGNDFTEYWSSGRLLLNRGNPYDPTQLLAVEQVTGWRETSPLLMWNPPYTLALVLPFVLLPFDVAAMAWLGVNIILVSACGAALWAFVAPAGDKRYWIGIVAAIAYLPTLQTLRIGQISIWLLAAITGFLVAIKYKKDYLAGAALALLAIKPHVAYLLLAGAAYWILRERRWKVAAGAAAVLLGSSILVTAISPQVFSQYFAATAHPPLYWKTTTLGTWLRIVFDFERGWLQFLPSALGLTAFGVWLVRHHNVWDWQKLAPPLLLASAITAAYGWAFDYVVLLPAVIVLLVNLRHMPPAPRTGWMIAYLLSQIGMLILNQRGIDASYYYWFPLVLAGLSVWQKRMLRFSTTYPA